MDHLGRFDVFGARVDVMKFQADVIGLAAVYAIFRLLILDKLPHQFLAPVALSVFMCRAVFLVPAAVVFSLLLFIADGHKKIAGQKTPLF